MAKKLNFGIDSITKINDGVTDLAKAVKVTLGPKGRTVILYRGFGSPHVTKDGVTVAKDVEFEDSTSNMAAELVKEVSAKTAEHAGDGTTTATVLSEAIFSRGYNALVKRHKFYPLKKDLVPTGVNAMDLKRGIESAVEDVTKRLKEIAIEVEDSNDINDIATISANNDPELGKLIADAYEKLGNEVIILQEESPYLEPTSKLKLIEGIQFDKGFMSPSFTNDQGKSKVEFENPMFLMIPGKVTNPRDLIRAVETSLETGRGLVVIAEDFDVPVLEFLVKNKLQAQAKLVAIKAPGLGEQRYQKLLDLCSVTGCKTLDPKVGEKINSIKESDMGSAHKILITATETIIISDDKYSENINKRLIELDKESKSKGLPPYQVEAIQKRMAQLKGKLAMIQLGARTEAELKEKKDRIEDAIEATKSAIQEGYVVGSGLALYRISEDLKVPKGINKDFTLGYNIIKEAIKVPLETILTNGGNDPVKIIKEIDKLLEDPLLRDGRYKVGYNSLTDNYCDLVHSGVIDPVKVTRLALANASSIACLLLTTGCSISLN